jgi:2-oxoglutarate ferredoxin oxidoreductase subunit beta
VGFKTKASPYGTEEAPLNATLMALSHGASFVARLFAGNPVQISDAIIQGIDHQGFSFFHVYTSCVTFDKQFKTWNHLKEKTHALPNGYDDSDQKAAIHHVLDDNYSLGVVYRKKIE